jgi:ribosome maturation factor RimP
MLVPGFVRMVDKHRVIKSLDGWTVEGLEIRGVDIRAGRTARVSVTLVSDRPVTLEQIDAVKAKIAERLGREIVLEAGVVLVR